MKFLIIVFIMLLIVCMRIENNVIKESYNYQCYKYYDSNKVKIDEEKCKNCLCIDTSKIDKKKF